MDSSTLIVSKSNIHSDSPSLNRMLMQSSFRELADDVVDGLACAVADFRAVAQHRPVKPGDRGGGLCHPPVTVAEHGVPPPAVVHVPRQLALVFGQETGLRADAHRRRAGAS